MRKRWFAVLSLMVVAVQSTEAQDAGRFGISLQVPAALGFIWHATDHIALRPEFNLSRSTDKFILGSGETRQTNLLWEVALSAPIYLSNQDNVRTYISPRFGYTRMTLDQSSSPSQPESHRYSYSASFGAQYAPVKRLNLFGETGYGYSTSNSSSSFRSNDWSMRSAVGVILYVSH